jgi:hypothetical protein
MSGHGFSRSLAVVGVTAAALLLIAGVVFGLGDRATLVPPPEAVAEGLVRQLATHRYRQTTQYVAQAFRPANSDDAGTTLDPRWLRAWFEPIERRIGQVRKVEGQQVSIGDDTAQALVQLEGERGHASAVLSLTRERGLWLVQQLTEQ